MLGLVSAWREWRERSEILRDVRRRADDRKEFDKFKVRDLLLEAKAAAEVSDFRKAGALWQQAVGLDREAAADSPHVVKLLIALKRLDEAEELLAEGDRKYPGDAHYSVGLAAIADAGGDTDEALKRYAALRKRFPGEAAGYSGGTELLRKLGRLDEADTVAAEMMRKFPGDIRGFLSRARILTERMDWDAALAQWQLVADRFPSFGFGVFGIADVYTKTGRFDEADAVIEAARPRYNGDSGLSIKFAQVAQARGETEEAIRRWKRRIERFPMEWWGYRQAAEALTEMGELAEAEAVLRAAVERFEDNFGQLRDLASFLAKHGDPAAEEAVWQTVQERYPSQAEGYLMRANLLRRLRRDDDAGAVMAAHDARFAAAG